MAGRSASKWRATPPARARATSPAGGGFLFSALLSSAPPRGRGWASRATKTPARAKSTYVRRWVLGEALGEQREDFALSRCGFVEVTAGLWSPQEKVDQFWIRFRRA